MTCFDQSESRIVTLPQTWNFWGHTGWKRCHVRGWKWCHNVTWMDIFFKIYFRGKFGHTQEMIDNTIKSVIRTNMFFFFYCNQRILSLHLGCVLSLLESAHVNECIFLHVVRLMLSSYTWWVVTSSLRKVVYYKLVVQTEMEFKTEWQMEAKISI